ncbi:lysoplasmalogenase [uncultured Mycolicibacterium sp.]|uniref:lysoplasmalogenase n=1 Tax=uncultured Mycolicibacterium sp. TaxID=2320817 RepID=UPI0032B303A0
MTQARRRREPTVPVGSSRARTLWFGAALVAVGYGVFLIVVATRVPSGTDLTGQFALQPAVKALTAVVLAAAAVGHPVVRERRWLIGALLFSAAGDYLLAMPWWEASFVLGLAAFLIAHLCFLAALMPLAAPTRPRLAAAGLTVASCVALLVWFWPRLIAEGMAVPVTLYIAVLGAMVCAALLADLPTPWTALGAVSFAVSDAMIGISRFVLGDERLAVPIWWFYAASLLLLTAGLLFGRSFGSPSGASATPAG